VSSSGSGIQVDDVRPEILLGELAVTIQSSGRGGSYALVYNAMLKMFAEHIKEAVQNEIQSALVKRLDMLREKLATLAQSMSHISGSLQQGIHAEVEAAPATLPAPAAAPEPALAPRAEPEPAYGHEEDGLHSLVDELADFIDDSPSPAPR